MSPNASNPPRRARLGLVELSARITGALTRRYGAVLQRRHYPDGATVAQRGQMLRSVLVLRSGRLRVATTHRDGREQFLRWTDAGEVAGVASVLCDLPLQVDLIANGDCEIDLIPGTRFVAAMNEDARLALDVARFLSLRLTDLFDRVAVIGNLRLEDRLYSALVHLAVVNGERHADGGLTLRVTQQDLSDAVVASRQRVNEALHRLQQAGQLQLGYGRIQVHPTDRFRLEAGPEAQSESMPVALGSSVAVPLPSAKRSPLRT